MADPLMRFVDSAFLLWVLVGLAFPFGLGWALTGTVVGGLTGMLWGGAVRIFVLHHVTFSVNSLCHFFGRQPYPTGDESRNLASAGAADDGGVLAQQPPRLPDLGQSRPAPLGGGRLRSGDLGAGEARPRLGRGADQPGADGGHRRPAPEHGTHLLLPGDRARRAAGHRRAVPDLQPRPRRDRAAAVRLEHPPERRILPLLPRRHPLRDRDRPLLLLPRRLEADLPRARALAARPRRSTPRTTTRGSAG